MRIEKIKIKNLGPLQNGEWDIDTSRQFAVLCGPHGTGKSTFLNAVGTCLTNTLTLDPIGPYPGADPDYSVEIRLRSFCSADETLLGASHATFTDSSYMNLYRRRAQAFGDKVPFGIVRPQGFVPHVLSGTQHAIFHSMDEDIQLFWVKPSDANRRIDPVLVLARSLRHLRETEGSYESKLDFFNAHLSKAVNLKLIVKNGVLMCARRNKTTPLQAIYLSEAEYCAIGVLLFSLFLLPPSGLLLIDSPEMFMHPAALDSLLSSSAAQLTTGQLIIATHSPSVIARRAPAEVYVLDHNNRSQKARRADDEVATATIKRLYGKDVSGAILSAIRDRTSTNILRYLLECSVSPSAITRKVGDPQIQQLATWLLGFLQSESQKKRIVVDFGAGEGDLLTAIESSGCASLLHYHPIEPNKAYWRKINQRVANLKNLGGASAPATFLDVGRADLVFFVNVLHELNLETRIELLTSALKLTESYGVVVIHEVTSLPTGEANFVMWDAEDIRSIFRDIRSVSIMNATTLTRPDGWPLETVCLRSNEPTPSTKQLKASIVRALPEMLTRWTKRLKAASEKIGPQEREQRLIAFLTAQVAQLNVWSFDLSRKKSHPH